MFKDHSDCKGRYITSKKSIVDAKRACKRDKTCKCISNVYCEKNNDDEHGDFNLFKGGSVRSSVGCSWSKTGIFILKFEQK